MMWRDISIKTLPSMSATAFGAVVLELNRVWCRGEEYLLGLTHCVGLAPLAPPPAAAAAAARLAHGELHVVSGAQVADAAVADLADVEKQLAWTVVAPHEPSTTVIEKKRSTDIGA
jgi:hypothetical protein